MTEQSIHVGQLAQQCSTHLVYFCLPEPGGLLSGEEHLDGHLLSPPLGCPDLPVAPGPDLGRHLDLLGDCSLDEEGQPCPRATGLLQQLLDGSSRPEARVGLLGGRVEILLLVQLLRLVLEVDAGDEEDQGDHGDGDRAEEHQVEDGRVHVEPGVGLGVAELLLVPGHLVHGVEQPVAEVALLAALDGGGGGVRHQVAPAHHQAALLPRQAAEGSLRQKAVSLGVVDLLSGGETASSGGSLAGAVGTTVRTGALAVTLQAEH